LSRINKREPGVDLLSPDIIVEVRAGPEQGVYRGVPAVTEYFSRYFGTWDDFRVVVDELVRAGDDKVFVAARDTGRGRRSGAAVEMDVFQVWTLENRIVVKWQGFPDRGEALKAAGLSKQDAHADS
jgi:ketosteroid isomerase-like protein